MSQPTPPLTSKPQLPAKPHAVASSSSGSGGGLPSSVLQCQLCSAPYDDTQHQPKLLPCHHSFCLSCLNDLAHERPHFRCPDSDCRRKCSVPPGGVGQLQANFYIKQLQSVLLPAGTAAATTTAPDASSLCSKHLQQPLLFYCNSCQLPICMNCTVLDHDKSAGHQITDIASVVAANKRALQRQLDVTSAALSDYQRRLTLLKTEMSNLEIAKDTSIAQIKKTFQQLVDKLDQRRAELEQQAEETYSARRQHIVEHAQHVKAKTTQLQALTKEITQQYESDSIGSASELLLGQQAMHDVKDLCQDAKTSFNLNNAFIRFQFEHGLQEYLMSIRGLGKVLCESGLPSDVHIETSTLTAATRAQIKVSISDVSGVALAGYPITAQLQRESPSAQPLLLKPRCQDAAAGEYVFEFMPQTSGTYSFTALFNEQAIFGAKQTLTVDANNPVLTFGSEGSGPGNLNHPTSVAVSSHGNVYVADMGNKRIQVFDASGAHKQSFGVGGSKSTTYDVTISPASGELLCSKVGPSESGVVVGNTIRTFGLHGEKLHSFSNPEMQRSMFLAVNSKGHIVATDSQQHCVFIHSKEGVAIKRFGSHGQRHAQFDLPSAVAVGKEDTILVSDTKNDRVQIFSKAGKFMRQLGPRVEGKDGPLAMRAPRGLAADAAHIVVADSSQRLLVFTWDMQLAGVIDSEASPINEPYNLTLTCDGHVLVADFKNNCVKKYKYK